MFDRPSNQSGMSGASTFITAWSYPPRPRAAVPELHWKTTSNVNSEIRGQGSRVANSDLPWPVYCSDSSFHQATSPRPQVFWHPSNVPRQTYLYSHDQPQPCSLRERMTESTSEKPQKGQNASNNNNCDDVPCTDYHTDIFRCCTGPLVMTLPQYEWYRIFRGYKVATVQTMKSCLTARFSELSPCVVPCTDLTGYVRAPRRQCFLRNGGGRRADLPDWMPPSRVNTTAPQEPGTSLESKMQAFFPENERDITKLRCGRFVFPQRQRTTFSTHPLATVWMILFSNIRFLWPFPERPDEPAKLVNPRPTHGLFASNLHHTCHVETFLSNS